jgi:hypothetical protein
MLKVSLKGDWAKASKALKNPARLNDAIKYAVRLEAEYVRQQIIKGLDDQAPAGQRFVSLSQLTRVFRQARGFSGKKALIVSAGLRNSVTVKKVGRLGLWVGVNRSARTKDGHSLANVANLQENGGVIVIRVTPKMRRYVMMVLRQAGLIGRTFRDRRTGRFARGRRSSDTGAHKAGTLASGVLIVHIPARPFIKPVMEKHQRDRKMVEARLRKRISRYMGGALGS